MSDLHGTLQSALAGYTLERQLGRGGMATVFLAQDLKHKRPVALKVLHPELAHVLGPERFHREVELAARLQHPHILTVLDSGEAAGQLWFTMPFVDGESLRDRINRERQLPVEEAVRIASEVAKALDYAHRNGVIHRDIKPENILLTKDGDTLVADFGIARGLSSTEARLTETGMAVGTPAYMSPEQASGERQLDARTDVYALGAVLFEMLVGEPPFTGATAQAVIAKRFSGEVPKVRATRPNVSPAIEAAVSQALAPVAADRFASAGDFAKALGGGATTSSTMARPSAPVAQPTVSSRAPRRMPAGAALLVLGFLIGVGVLFAWKRGGHPGKSSGTRVIAVLPFDNQGDSTQEYFADGITDEVRGKLSGLPGLQVIAGASSKAYRRTDKPLNQVATELGADYLLMAKVRWAKNADGSTQVQVSPELIAIAGGKPTTRWQRAFEASLTNVFQVQADIAGQVAQALDVALADSVSRQLAAKPTSNLPAYDAFLRGEQIFITQGANDPTNLRRAVAYYRQAVALDSTFALAWARMGRAQGLMYSNGVPDPAMAAAALEATQRAIALDPKLPDARLSLSGYYRDVVGDIGQARREAEATLQLDSRNPDALGSISILDAMSGQWDSSIVHARQATRLDPLSSRAALRLGSALRKTGRLEEARAEFDRGIALSPGNLPLIQGRIMVEVTAGNLDSAHALLRLATQHVEPTALVAYIANYWDLFWVLDHEQQQLLLSTSPADYDNDRTTWAIVLAQHYWVHGDQARSRAYADTARLAALELKGEGKMDGQRQLFLGLAEAYSGKKAEAIRDAEQGAASVPAGKDAITGTYFQHVLARVYVITGEYDKAIDILHTLLQSRYDLSPAWLRIDPNFAPLRGNPRFEKLVAGS
ncbi:MAG TPA: protein kinase [Gemmatimonadales bacterium]|nr:protein kinase [Gemmatimonadales bacterium]